MKIFQNFAENRLYLVDEFNIFYISRISPWDEFHHFIFHHGTGKSKKHASKTFRTWNKNEENNEIL